jgi:PH-interacting protein
MIFILTKRDKFDPFVLVQPEVYCSMRFKNLIKGHFEAICCACFDRTGRTFFTGSNDSLVKAWSSNGNLLTTFRGHEHGITDINVNHENTILASSSFDKTIRIWSLKNKQCIATLSGHAKMVTKIEFSPFRRFENRFFVSVGNDGIMCVWNLVTFLSIQYLQNLLQNQAQK